MAAAVGVDLAVGALVNALVGGRRVAAASLASRALSALASAGTRVGVLGAVGARGGASLGVPTSRAGLATSVGEVLAGRARARALRRAGQTAGTIRAGRTRGSAAGRVGVGRTGGAGRGIGAAVGTTGAVGASAVGDVLSGRTAKRVARRGARAAGRSGGAGLAARGALHVGKGSSRARGAGSSTSSRVGTRLALLARAIAHVATSRALGLARARASVGDVTRRAGLAGSAGR